MQRSNAEHGKRNAEEDLQSWITNIAEQNGNVEVWIRSPFEGSIQQICVLRNFYKY